MRKIIDYCFDKWWRPILLGSLTIVFFAISEIIKNSFIASLGFTLFVIGLFYMLISTYYQLSQKRWIKSILTFLMFCGTIVAFIFYSMIFWINQEPSYSWTDKLEISSSIKFDEPMNMGFDQFKPKTLTNSIITSSDHHLPFDPSFKTFNSSDSSKKLGSSLHLTIIEDN